MGRPTLSKTALSSLVVVSFVSHGWAAITVTAANRATAPSDANTAAIVEITGSQLDRFDRQLAQTFLAEQSGALQRVAVTAGARSGAAQTDGLGLRVGIASFDQQSGQLGPTLAIAAVEGVERLPGIGGPFSQPDVLQASADFESSGVVLNAGSSYAMTFSAERLEDSFFVLGGTLPDYEEGLIGGRLNDEPFRFQPITDLFFEITVDAVPEPGSVAMTLATLPLMSRRRAFNAGKQLRRSGSA